MILNYGDWGIVLKYDEYRIIHLCKRGAYSRKNGPAYSRKNGPVWTTTDRLTGTCVGCEQLPPATMQGFVTLLQWEKT